MANIQVRNDGSLVYEVAVEVRESLFKFYNILKIELEGFAND